MIKKYQVAGNSVISLLSILHQIEQNRTRNLDQSETQNHIHSIHTFTHRGIFSATLPASSANTVRRPWQASPEIWLLRPWSLTSERRLCIWHMLQLISSCQALFSLQHFSEWDRGTQEDLSEEASWRTETCTGPRRWHLYTGTHTIWQGSDPYGDTTRNNRVSGGGRNRSVSQTHQPFLTFIHSFTFCICKDKCVWLWSPGWYSFPLLVTY